MADFKDFEAFESRQDLCPADEGNELGGEIEKLCRVVKDHVITSVVDSIDHSNPQLKTFEGIESCLTDYRIICQGKIEKYLGDLPPSIKEYAEQKLLFTSLKTPRDVLKTLQKKIEDLVAEYVPKLSEAYEAASLVCNYVLDPREYIKFPTDALVQASVVTARVCRAPYCFSVYNKDECAGHLATHSLTPKTKSLFLNIWTKTDDRLYRSCNICSKVGQFIPQHLRNVHGINKAEQGSTLLSEQRTDIGPTVSMSILLMCNNGYSRL